jgi:hypothetical protein
MGYRSQVVYAIEPDIDSEDKDVGLGKWRMFLAEARVQPKTAYAMSMIDNTGMHVAKDKKYWTGGLDSKNNSIMIELLDVKWYDSYPEVESFKSLIELAESEGYTDHINLAYVRIGEEDGDVETYHVNEGYRLITTWSSYDYADVSFQETDEDRRNVSTKPKQKEKNNV